MNALKPVLLSLLVIGATLLSSTANAIDLTEAMMNPPNAFSAKQVMTSTENGTEPFNSKLFREGQKMRMDISEEGQEMSIVIRMDTKTNYMFMHNMKMFQEMRTEDLEGYQSSFDVAFSNQKEVGGENVNGYDTTKYTADYKVSNGEVGSGTFWISKSGVVIRSVTKNQGETGESTTNLTNVSVADQADELFEIPSGYNTLNLGRLMQEHMSDQ